MKKAHYKILMRITQSIPEDLKSRLIRKEPLMPTVKEIATKAVTDPDVSPEDKRKYQAMLDSGHLDKTVDVVDNDVEKQINDYLGREIDKEVAMGHLPKIPPKMMMKKSKKYVRKQIATRPSN